MTLRGRLRVKRLRFAEGSVVPPSLIFSRRLIPLTFLLRRIVVIEQSRGLAFAEDIARAPDSGSGSRKFDFISSADPMDFALIWSSPKQRHPIRNQASFRSSVDISGGGLLDSPSRQPSTSAGMSHLRHAPVVPTGLTRPNARLRSFVVADQSSANALREHHDTHPRRARE